MSFVITKSNSCNIWATAVLFEISRYILDIDDKSWYFMVLVHAQYWALFFLNSLIVVKQKSGRMWSFWLSSNKKFIFFHEITADNYESCRRKWLRKFIQVHCNYESHFYTSSIFHSVESIKSLRPCDATWRHRSGSTLAQVMACCLSAPSRCQNQCWFHISETLWHSPESNFASFNSVNYMMNLKNVQFRAINDMINLL